MGYLDRLPTGRKLLAALAALVLVTVGAALYLGRDTGGEPEQAAVVADDRPFRVDSEDGGFSLRVPGQLTGTRLGPNIQVGTPDRSLLVTVGPGDRTGAVAAQKKALATLRSNYQQVEVDRADRTTLGPLPARRAVGTLSREDGGRLVFAITTGARGRQTWSVVMFATEQVTRDQLAEWYRPVVDGFRVL